MSFLKELAQSAKSTISVWHQFTVSHNPNKADWYIFVEGQLDASFYASALRAMLPAQSRVIDFRCDGKRGVLRARNEIQKTHPDCSRVLFFVDKDLDNLIPGVPLPSYPNLYCTSSYSIENYFVTEEAMEIIWTQLWLLRSDDPTWPQVRIKLTDLIHRFSRLMLPIMAWYVLARMANQQPYLNNLKIAEIVSFDNCELRLKKSAFMRLKQKTSCEYRPSFQSWLHKVRELQQHDPKHILRGKFELWMFCRFLELISQALSEREQGKPNRSIPISSDGITLALIGKITPPNELLGHLKAALVRGAPHA